MTFMMMELTIKAAFLCLLLYIFARHEADFSFQKVLMVAAGMVLGTMLITFGLEQHIGLFAFIPNMLFVAFMLVKFCWISYLKAIPVTILFFAFHIGYALCVAALMGSFFASSQKTSSLTEQHMNDTEEARQVMMDALAVPGQQGPTAFPETEMADAPVDAVQEEQAKQDTGSMSMEEANRILSQVEAQQAATTNAAPLLQPVVGETNEWAVARKLVLVSGTISGRKGYAALVNNKVVEKGSTVSVESGGKVFRWRIIAISKDWRLDLEPLDVR